MNAPSYLTAMFFACMGIATGQAETLRYRLSGDWSKFADADGAGWGVNPNIEGAPGAGLPGSSDEARINWGGNTVTVSTTVPAVGHLQIGVDESGTVVVASGGVLEAVNACIAENKIVGIGAVPNVSFDPSSNLTVVSVLAATPEP